MSLPSSSLSSPEWPYEIAKEISFYHPKKNSSSSQTISSPHHLTLQTNKSGTKQNLILYNESTNEIVDRINTNDIIGVELEISFTNDDGGSSSNDDNDDNSGDRNVDNSKKEDYSNEIGINHPSAKERANEMESFEKKLLDTKLLASYSSVVVTNDGDDGDDSNANSPDIVDNNNNNNSNALHSSNSAAYLNIYCYPRKEPQPGITTLVKNCIGKYTYTSSSSSSSSTNTKPTHIYNPLSKDDNDKEELDETDETTTQMGHRYEYHRKYKLYLKSSNNDDDTTMEDFTKVTSLIQAIRHVANINPYTTDTTTEIETETTAATSTTAVPKRKKQYLVIVNPFSGQKQGKHIYETVAKKMLEESGIDHTVLITQYSGHAVERMQHKHADDDGADNDNDHNEKEDDVTKYDAIICLGGDGILSEILNGLKMRKDYEHLLQTMNFGIVGCGTCNGLAASLLYAAKEKYGAIESLFRICKGNTNKLDLAIYETTATKEKKTYTSFLTMTWAMIADIDIESECIRCLGILRNDLWGAWCVLKMRSYRAKFSYLPPPPPLDNVAADGTSSSTGNDMQNECPPINSDVPSNWITIEADFILFWASLVTHAAHNVLQSPASKLQDGVFRIWVVRKPCSRIQMAGMLIDMETGNHTKYKNAEFFDCVAFRLDPSNECSFNDVDGEVVEPGRIQAHISSNKLNIIS